jgi:hypothetical protein
VTSIVIELNVDFAGKTFAEVEAGVMVELRRRVGPVLQVELNALVSAVGRPRCPHCQGERRQRGTERRRVTGLFGTVEIARPRVECVPCATSSYPADQRLGLEAGERYSLGVAEAALWLATDVSYAKSSATVGQVLDIGISHGQIHRLAQREGQLVADAWAGLRQRVFGDGDRGVLADLERDVAAPAVAVIQADGTFVHDRGETMRMEAKGGIVYTGVATVSRGRRRLLGKRTYGSLDDMAAFGETLVLTAARAGAFKAKELWFISDGSAALRHLRRAHFPTAIPFLDVWHLEKRIAEALGDELTQQYLGPLMTMAVAGQVDQLITALAEHWAQETEDDIRHQLLGDLIEYVDANRDGIASYARRGAQASSPIEKVMDVVIGRRLKAKGTSWHRPGADRILHLRVLKENKSWDRYWTARRSRTSLIAALAA